MGRELLQGIGALFIVIPFAFAAISGSAQAYTQTMTPGGRIVRWSGEAKLNLAGNPANANGLSESAVRSATVHGLQRWYAAGQGRIAFDYWQGSSPAVYQANSDYNGYSNLYFASTSRGASGISPNVLGLTQVWYNTDTGEILETDILLNDRDFRFTSNPRDTSGYGSGGTTFLGGKPNVFLENVITHELGHAFGLSHTEGLQSTMLFMESPEQAYLGCDDQIGIQALYGGDAAPGRGSASGTITSPAGVPVFGAHVQVISQKRGVLLASALTDQSGNYRVGALEPGTYFIMVEPFAPGAAALPSYYGAVNSAVCGNGRQFARTFLLDSSGVGLVPVTVQAGANAQVPSITVRCTGSEMARGMPISSMGYKLLDGATNERRFGILDILDSDSVVEHVFQLRGISGRLRLHALSYSMYSPLQPELRLKDDYGREVPASITHPVYEGNSGFTNFDALLTAEDLPLGDYYLEVSGSRMVASMYPAGPMLLDGTPFLVLTGTLNDSSANASAELADNARCRMSEDFPAYASPPGDPPRSSRSGDSGGIGFCGTVKVVSPDAAKRFGGNASGNASGAEILGWFAPWLLMGIARLLFSTARIIRRSRLAHTGVGS